MSHFTVTVIGENAEDQLLPFHQFECTGLNEYIQEIECLEEYLEEYEVQKVKYPDDYESFQQFVEEWYGIDSSPIGPDDEPEIDGDHKYGYCRVDGDGNIVSIINRTNPNYKWDWYQLGGRWAGMLLIKPEFAHLYSNDNLGFSWGWDVDAKKDRTSDGVRADKALKGHIDFAGMRNLAESKASAEYDNVMEHIGHLPPSRSWADIRDEYAPDYEKAREFYHGQDRVKAFVDLQMGFYTRVEDYNIFKMDYVDHARNSAFSTYSLLKDGEWHTKGEMGWFGCSNDLLTQEEWNKKFNDLIDSLPDDTVISVYDCHI